MSFPSSYLLYQEVTIDHTKVSADLTDYVVYVNLADLVKAGADIFDTCRSDGGDIRATKSDGTTQLATELVAIDTTAKTGELHVKFTGTLSSSTDTIIRIWYNGTDTALAVTDTYGRNAVWSDYVLVLHMDESSGNALDSTSNGYDMTDHNTVGSGTGKLNGGARDFEYSNSEYFSLADNADISLSDSPVTIQSWFNLESVSNVLYYISQKGWYISTTSNLEFNQIVYTGGTPDDFRTEMYDGSFRSSIATAVTINTGTWYYGVSRHDPSANLLYTRVNTTDATAGTMNVSKNGTTGLYIGVGHGGTEASKEYYMDGLIDEYRYRKSFLSNDWLTTEYNNQNSPSTFYSAGSEQGGGGGSTFTPVVSWFM